MIAMLGIDEIAVDRAPRMALAWKRGDYRTWARYNQAPKTWVAEITGRAPGRQRYQRAFVDGQRDYTHSNRTGARGVERWYELREGRVYEVSEPLSWSRGRRYYCRAEAGQIVEISESDVEAWLDAHTTNNEVTP